MQFECPWCQGHLGETWVCEELSTSSEAYLYCPHCGKALELYEEEESGEIAVMKF